MRTRALFVACLLALTACDDDADEAGDAARAPDAGADAAAPDAGPPDGAPSDAARDAAADGAPDAAPADALPPDAGPIGGDRPANVFAPAGPPPAEGWPVLVLLHGFRANPILMDRNFPFSRKVEEAGVVVVLPVGKPDENGFLFWEAHNRLDPEDVGVDVEYLRGVVAEVVARHRGDADRVYVLGHSNGGAMAVHLACHAADLIRGFVNVAGFNPPVDACAPARPVTALFVHGTDDDMVPYAGRDPLPGADEAAAHWADRFGCGEPTEAPEPVDFDNLEAGAETHRRQWAGCAGGVRVERWRMEGSGHIIGANDAFLDAMLAALLGR